MILESDKEFYESFTERYTKEFGFTLDREVLIDDARVRAYGKTKIIDSTLDSTADISPSSPTIYPSSHACMEF